MRYPSVNSTIGTPTLRNVGLNFLCGYSRRAGYRVKTEVTIPTQKINALYYAGV